MRSAGPGPGRGAGRERGLAGGGPVNWQLGGRLVAGARQQRGARLPTPCSRPHSSGWKDGRCPALRVGGGRGTHLVLVEKGLICLLSSAPPIRRSVPNPSSDHLTRDTHWAASPPSPGCSEPGLAGAGAEVGTGKAPGRAGRASRVSGAVRIPGAAGSGSRNLRIGQPRGFGAPGLFLIIGANGVLYRLNPTHMVS